MNVFKDCVITPVGFSEHSLLKCEVFFKCVKPKSAYWHINNILLDDEHFKDVFKAFWANMQMTKSNFQTLQQWWDLAKVQIKQLCQQYTHNVTKEKIKDMEKLEDHLIKMQENLQLRKIKNDAES